MARQSVAGEDHISAALLPQSQVPEPRPPSLRPRDPAPSPPSSDPGSQSQSLPQTQESRAQPSSPRPKSPETNPPFPGPGGQTPVLLPQGQRPDSIPLSDTGIQVLPLLPETQGPVDFCPPPLDPGDPPTPAPHRLKSLREESNPLPLDLGFQIPALLSQTRGPCSNHSPSDPRFQAPAFLLQRSGGLGGERPGVLVFESSSL